MAEITKEIVSPLFQRTGEDLYKINPETVASVVYTSEGETVEQKLEELTDAVDDLGGGGTSKPWTAYGEGEAGAPEEMREGGLYVSDGEEAPTEATEALLRQMRDDSLVPVYPRTDAALVTVSADGVASGNVADALAEVAEAADLAQATAEQNAQDIESLTETASGLSTAVTAVQGDVSSLQTAVQNIETQVESVECAMVSGAVELAEDVAEGGEVETPGMGYKPGNSTLQVWYEGLKCRLGEQYEETEATAGGYATAVRILFDAEAGATFEFLALNGVTV